jgi:lysophospholipase L1-like esterase
MHFNGKKINFLGDSITEGRGTQKRYTDLLKVLLGLSEARNYGVSGSRIARQAGLTVYEGAERDFCMRAEEMAPDADAVVVFGGTNDYGHGNAPLGKITDHTPETFYGALHTLMRYLCTVYVGKPIVFLTPLHRVDDDKPTTQERACGKKELLVDYVSAIREVAQLYSLPVLDLYATSGIQPNIPAIRELLVPDGLHPNDEGHRILAERIANFLLAY